jgi:hypothetical protein
MTELALFPPCPLPGCRNITTGPHQPCPGCLEAFGPLLRPGAGPVPDPAVYAEGDAVVLAILAERRAAPARPGWMRSQRCWVCDERRTCRPDPAYPDGRMICRGCSELDA